MRFRALFLAAVPLLAVASPALAAGASHVGVRAGVNLSAFTGDLADILEPDSRAAANVGLVYEYDFAPRLSFHGELGYAGKGGVSESSAGTDPFGNPTPVTKDRWAFEYLEIPLMARGRFPDVGQVTPFFELGPTIGIKLSGKLQSQTFGDADLTDRMKSADLGFGIGTGVTFAAGPGRLGVEARYTHGFRDLFEGTNDIEAINQAWTLALSYTL